MEIERKWMVTNWPDEKSFPLTETYQMDQGYISVRPTVRIRREALQGGRTALVLCFKRKLKPKSMQTCSPDWSTSSASPLLKRNAAAIGCPTA